MNKRKTVMLMVLVAISVLAGTLISTLATENQKINRVSLQTEQTQQWYNDTIKINILKYESNYKLGTTGALIGGVMVDLRTMPFEFKPSSPNFNITDVWVFVVISGDGLHVPVAAGIDYLRLNGMSWIYVGVGSFDSNPAIVSVRIQDPATLASIKFGINTITLDASGWERVYQVDVLVEYEYFR